MFLFFIFLSLPFVSAACDRNARYVERGRSPCVCMASLPLPPAGQGRCTVALIDNSKLSLDVNTALSSVFSPVMDR